MQHIQPGEPIRASMLNQLIDHVDDSETGQIGGIPNFRISSTTIRIKADADLPRFAVVGIDDILFDPAVNKEAFSKEPAVRAGQPNAATKNFAILQQPATTGQIVPACVSGVSIVELVIGNAQHEFAVPNANYTMTTAESGVARILWKQTTPGDDGKTWGLVSFPVGGDGGSVTPTPTETYATIVLPICRAINPHAQGDWNIPFGNIFQTQFNSRSHFAAASGFVAVDGKNYSPVIDHVDDTDPDNPVTYYRTALRVRSDVNFDCFGNTGIDGANAHYTTIGKLQRPVIEYVDGSGEWTPWQTGFTWATTTDESLAWKNYDIAACKTLDYSEVLVPGERVKVLGTETHSFYETADGGQQTAADASVTIVEAPANYTVQFEGCADVNEFGVWNKERKITGNASDVVSTTIDENYVIGQGTNPYQYWGFDVVDLLPNGNAAWTFIDIAAFPTLSIVEGTGTCYNTDHVSRPELSDDVFIQNNSCNTRAYGLWYKTDKDGLRYPILCSVESLTFGTGIETRRSYCNSDCDTSWTVFEFEITRNGNRLKLPTVYCSVSCPIDAL